MTTPPPSTGLGPGAEFDMIRSIWRRIGSRGGIGGVGAAVGAPGDDCAFFSVGDSRLAISSDLSIEGTHFRTGWIEPDEIGWRAAMAALSDLAAVAASPLGVMVSLGVSREQPTDLTADLMAGVAEASGELGAAVWGGDLVEHDRLVVDVTVVGTLDGPPLLRTGAKVGDTLFVTGRLGGPASAVAAWESHREPSAAARSRFARPVARVREALWLRERGGGARAAIDLSDGLLADARHLAAASQVACVLDLGAVPVHPGVGAGAGAGAQDGGERRAMTSGEEYELLVAMEDDEAVVSDFTNEFGVPLTRVGRVEPGSDVRVMQGNELVTDLESFTHF